MFSVHHGSCVSCCPDVYEPFPFLAVSLCVCVCDHTPRQASRSVRTLLSRPRPQESGEFWDLDGRPRVPDEFKELVAQSDAIRAAERAAAAAAAAATAAAATA